MGVTVPGAVVCKLMRGSKATAPLTQVRLTDTSLLRSAGEGLQQIVCGEGEGSTHFSHALILLAKTIGEPASCLFNTCFGVLSLREVKVKVSVGCMSCVFCLVVVPLRGPRRSSGGEEGSEDSGAYVVTSDIQKVVTRQGQVRTTDRRTLSLVLSLSMLCYPSIEQSCLRAETVIAPLWT